MTYFRNVEKVIANKSRRSITQGGKAWDNVKVKMRNRHLPRGRVYAQLEKQERYKQWLAIKTELDTSIASHLCVTDEQPKLS